ncbi:phage tail protein [Clostridioides difficile]|nr:phage tail protein [Clostridioides difficile]MDK3213486.1 phage tail protein [Clostridioides difficile]MDK3292055.1 phage tail protein [Clostridioides difficile]
MSWAEIYKVNSDLQGEPLNFLSYLQDIKLNGLDSYVLFIGNARIWEELYLNSLYLFSDKGIRETVYTAFSETDIDNLFNKSTKLGEQLNAFYRTDIFSLGNADNVVKGMTIEHYNSLEEKFKAGYDRYVTREQEKSTIGAWFNSTFSLDNTDLENLTTIEEILANVEATNAILNNSNAIVALTMCKTSMDAVVASSNAMDLLGQYILKVTTEQQVIRAIIKNEVIRDAIINSNEAMTQISSNENSVMEIFDDLEATKVLVQNQNSINKILTNNVTVEKIIPNLLEMKSNLQISLNYIKTIKSNIVSSKGQILAITYNEKIFPLLKNIEKNHDNMENIRNLLQQDVEEKIKIADAILGSSIAMTAFANNSIIVNKVGDRAGIIENILSQTASLNAFMESTTAINILVNKTTAFTKIANNSNAMSVIANNSNTMSVIANSSNAMSVIANSSNAMASIVNSPTALDVVLARSVAMREIAKIQSAVNKITGTAVALNKVVKNSAAKSALATQNAKLQANKSAIHTILKNNSNYFREIIVSQKSDSSPTQEISSTYIGVTYCYGYNGGSGYGIVYHGHDTNIEAGRANGSQDENKKFITLGGTKFAESGDGYFMYSIYQAI